MMKNKTFIQAFICILLATVLALTTHIYVAKWMKPFLDSLMQDPTAQGISGNPDTYSSVVLFSAYATAFLMIGFIVFLYYHAQHLIPTKSKFKKVLLVTTILFGIKGDLSRQPIMNFILMYTSGFSHAFSYVVLDNIDKWLANFLLAICLVYVCPPKKAG